MNFRFFKNKLSIEIDSKRIYGLDILRAFAILFVVLEHSKYLVPRDYTFIVDIFVFDGVSIFFVLSGFLIGSILIRLFSEKFINYKLLINFWLRRWFRTIPNYLLILSLLVLLNLLFTKDFNLKSVFTYFVFSQNVFTVHPNFFPEAWSLSIEEWFYLIIPLILVFYIKVLKLTLNKSLLITVFKIIIIVTLIRGYRYFSLDIDNKLAWDLLLRKQVITRLDSIMFGVLAAFILVEYSTLWMKFKNISLIIGLLVFVTLKIYLLFYIEIGVLYSVFYFTLLAIGTVLILPYLSSFKTGEGVIYKILTYISLISYSMYLINLTLVQTWILSSIDWNYLKSFNFTLFKLIQYLLYWGLTIFLSILIYKFFELPIMRLRDNIKLKNTK